MICFGRCRWTWRVRSGAVGAGDRVYVGADYSNGGHVLCVAVTPSPYSVRAKWDRMVTSRGGFSATPAIYQGLVFAGSRDGAVYAFRADDGQAAWLLLQKTDYGFKTDGEILADLKADSSGVYAASRDSKLYCLDVNTGALKWIYYGGAPLTEVSTPQLTPDTIYMYVPVKGVVAIDKTSTDAPLRGAKWSVADAVQFLAQDEKYAYLAMKDHHIAAVDKVKGGVQFLSARADFTVFGTNLKDSTIYAANNKEVYAIRAISKPGLMGELVLEARPVGGEREIADLGFRIAD